MTQLPPNPYGRRRDEPMSAEEALATLNRALPFSDEAERGLLSCLLQDPARVMACRLALSEAAFYQEATRTIFVEMLTMDSEGLPIDSVLMTQRLRDQGKLERVGGAAAISEVFTFVPIPAHYPYYRKILIEKHRTRRAIHGRALAIAALFDHGREMMDADLDTTINAANQIVQAMDDSPTAETGTTATLSECLSEHADHMQALMDRKDSGDDMLIPTGFPTLDGHAGGIGQDEYWLVTGPTKGGKSVLAGCWVRHAARRGIKSKVYTNEISRRTYAGRLIAGESHSLDGGIERRGLADRREQDEYGKAMRSLQLSIGKLLLIDNSAGKYVEDIVADMRAERDQGVRLFVVDLIGKVRARQRCQSREQELAFVSGTLCDATKRLGVACVALAQENEDGQVRESRSLSFDCEAWIKIGMVKRDMKEGQRRAFSNEGVQAPEIVRDRRNLIVELARGFAAGDVIPCTFDGAKFLFAELTRDFNI